LDAVLKAQLRCLTAEELHPRGCLARLKLASPDEAKYSAKPRRISKNWNPPRSPSVAKAKSRGELLRAQQELAAAKPESETYDKAVKKLGEAGTARGCCQGARIAGRLHPSANLSGSTTGRRLAWHVGSPTSRTR
jgi:hypothetical protein